MDRRDLCGALQDAGFTYRDARKIVSAIVESLAKHLKEHHELALPFGTIKLQHREVRRRISFGRISKNFRTPKATFTENK